MVESPKLKETDLFEVVTSRRHWDSTANNNYNYSQFIRQSAVGNNPRKQQNIEVGSLLKNIESDGARYEAFTKFVQKIIPEFTKWAIGYEDHEYIEYISADGVKHKTDFLGDGVISVIRILVHLFDGGGRGLIIDEPELSLHPRAQKKLIGLIAECSQKRQILISTHSPYFVNWEHIANGAKLNRIAKDGDTNSKIYSLGAPYNYVKLINGSNWQQPFLMDEVAKEIFFSSDNILFLEGQEDVGLLRGVLADTDIHLFGYGVRGCGNFEFALSMAKDLGFSKVAAILDKGADEDKIISTLSASFPNYKIIQWNKNDIRDKRAVTSIEKQGYFTEKGYKKTGDQLDDFEQKITSVKAYFKKTR